MSSSRRSALAFQMDTRPQPLFQRLLAALVSVIAALAVIAVAMALLAHRPEALPLWVLPLLVWSSMAMAWRWAQIRPRRLRWDGQAWWLQDQGSRSDEIQVQIEVLFDFGACVLLRTRPFLSQTRLRPVVLPFSYIPLFQAGQAQWALLRACLYSARSEYSGP